MPPLPCSIASCPSAAGRCGVLRDLAEKLHEAVRGAEPALRLVLQDRLPTAWRDFRALGPSKPSRTPAGSGSDLAPSQTPTPSHPSSGGQGLPLCETACGSEAELPEGQTPGWDTWVGVWKAEQA